MIEKKLKEIFPFHIQINKEHEIISLGKSIKKLLKNNIPKHFFDEFKILRPYIENPSYDGIIALENQAFFIQSVSENIQLRGEFVLIEKNQTLMYLCSLWINRVEDLQSKNLLLKDFALHDATFDFLHVIKQAEIHSEELKILLDKFSSQSKELRSSNKSYEILSKLINNSSDAIQIARENGQLYYINNVAAERLGINKNECQNFNVRDFEKIFQSEGNWLKHVEELKDKKELIIEGINENQITGEKFPVEVTVKYITVNNENYIIAFSRDITARKNSEKELFETKQRLESIFDEMTDVVYSVSLPERKLIFVTPSVKNLLGYSPDEIMKMETWWFAALPDTDKDIFEQVVNDLNETGSFKVSHRIITANGEIKWVKHKGKFILDEHDNPIRVDCQLADSTREYYAEEKLNLEVKLQEVLVDIASTYINLDLDKVDNTINESLKKMGEFVGADRAYVFDYDFENQITSNTYEWCNHGIKPEIENLQKLPIDVFPQWVQKHRENLPFYIPRVDDLDNEKDEGLKAILVEQDIKSLITVPLFDNSGLIGFVGFDSVYQYHNYSDKEIKLLTLFGNMIISIQERKRWERKLILQEEKFRNIITNMKLGLTEVDLNDNVIFANQSFYQMTGYTPEEIKGSKVSSLLLPKETQSKIEEKRNLRKEGVSDSYELEVLNKDNEKRWWLISGAPNYNDKGQLIGSIGIHLDITEQKRLEHDLAESISFAETASKAKELFLANMSHEIRTPLHGIIGMIRELSKQDLSQEQFFYVDHADSASRHLLNIINNILDISKIESGELQLDNKNFSLSSLAQNVSSILFAQAQQKNLDLILEISNALKPVHIGDELRLKQILINIVGNAIKFTDNGQIKLIIDVLESSNETQKIEIKIEDTGVGMSEDFVKNIFNKFSQEEQLTNRRYEGTGLGMAISYDLLKMMGGTLEVKSKKNVGSTFKFKLDLPIGDVGQLVSKSVEITPDYFSGKSVLLVEDNEMNRYIASIQLKYLGFDIDEATNGVEAIETLKTKVYDLILMDIQMPEMDGLEATEIIINDLKIKTPIIALTANAFRKEIERYLNKGMDDFITKPFDEITFFQKIKAVLNNEEPKSKTLKKVEVKNGEPLFSFDKVVSISRGDQDFVDKMKTIFVEQVEEFDASLKSAIENKDLEKINKAAHKIKPSIDQLDIHTLKEKIRSLEKFSLEKHTWDDLTALAHQVLQVLKIVSTQLK